MLPKLNAIKYELELPISKRSITVRPWLVGEEKALMIAKESKNPQEIANAIVNILTNCAFGENIEALPIVDVEYLLLMVKSYSNGEVTSVNIRCNNRVDDKPCGHIEEVDIDLHKEMSLSETERVDPNIQLTKTVGVTMVPPKFGSFRALLKDKTMTEITFETLAAAIHHVWNGDEIIDSFTPEELMDFVDNFTSDQLKKITAYLKSIPKLQVKHDYTCKKCGYKGEFVLENLFNFFTD